MSDGGLPKVPQACVTTAKAADTVGVLIELN
jgi:hypothetical protein